MKTLPLRYHTLLEGELKAVREMIVETLHVLPSTVREPLAVIIRQGGKQLRPALTLLFAHIGGADVQRALPVAAAVELLHTATLIHDDLIDQAGLRRGSQTLNTQLSPAATVLVGDTAFACAAQLVNRGQNLYLAERFAATLVTICKGELDQMFQRDDIPTLETYETRIFAKTASLFSLATEAGMLLAGPDNDDRVKSARKFGKLLGEAFQISDDALDLMGEAGAMGKPVGNDLRQGILTLPVLYYLEQHREDAALTGQIQAIVAQHAGETAQQALLKAVRASGAIEQAMAQAETRIARALDTLTTHPPSLYREATEEIAHFIVQRRY